MDVINGRKRGRTADLVLTKDMPYLLDYAAEFIRPGVKKQFLKPDTKTGGFRPALPVFSFIKVLGHTQALFVQ